MRVCVIGSGMGGLSAALQLARAGHDVCVFEAQQTLGGKVGYVELDGVKCDTGPSLLTMTDVVTTLLAEKTPTLTRPEPAFTYHWSDGVTLRFPDGVDKTLAEIESVLGTDAADQAQSFLSYAETIWTHAAPSFVFADASSILGIAKLSFKEIAALTKIDAMRSMLKGIRQHITEPHLQDIFARFATYNGSDPRVAPATLNCIAHVEIGIGGCGIEGGYYELTTTLVDVCAELGVTFETDAAVSSVVVESAVAKGVLVNGEVRRFDAIVSNVDVSHLEFDLLNQSTSTPEPSMSGWNAIVRAPTEVVPDAHTVFFPPRYLQEFEDIFDRGIVPTDPTVYVCNQHRAHGVEFGDGSAPLFLMVNAPPDPSLDFSGVWETVRRRLDVFNVLIPDPEWIRTPFGLADQFPGSNGSLYGASSNGRFAAFKRSPNKHPEIERLYVASGSAHPGGGVPMCLLSGMNAARALLDNI